MPKKESPTSNLARMVANGFAGVDGRLNKLDQRFEKFDDLFKVLLDEIRLMRADIKDVSTSLHGVVNLLGAHDKEITRLKTHVELDE